MPGADEALHSALAARRTQQASDVKRERAILYTTAHQTRLEDIEIQHRDTRHRNEQHVASAREKHESADILFLFSSRPTHPRILSPHPSSHSLAPPILAFSRPTHPRILSPHPSSHSLAPPILAFSRPTRERQLGQALTSCCRVVPPVRQNSCSRYPCYSFANSNQR